MSLEVTAKCNGCGNKVSGMNPYAIGNGWRSAVQQSSFDTAHACSVTCMVVVLRADADALEVQEGVRIRKEREHAEAQAKAVSEGIALQQNAERAKREAEDRRSRALEPRAQERKP